VDRLTVKHHTIQSSYHLSDISYHAIIIILPCIANEFIGIKDDCNTKTCASIIQVSLYSDMMITINYRQHYQSIINHLQALNTNKPLIITITTINH